jgi:alpha-tubulin suppressor-like RCC1 family protein
MLDLGKQEVGVAATGERARLGVLLAVLVLVLSGGGVPARGAVAPAVAAWTAVAVGDYGLACAIRGDRSLWCWDGSSSDRRTPAPVSGGGTWAAVDAGSEHICAIRTDGTLWCWDDLADSSPARVGADTTWATVSSAGDTTCATRTDGSLWCWESDPPVRVRPATRWSSVSVGDGHVCGVPVTGTVQCWGPDLADQPMGGDPEFRRASWASLATERDSCAVDTGHALWCWGEEQAPKRWAPAKSWSAVAVGAFHTCGLTTGGDMWCWGGNQSGQLGDGTTKDRADPVAVNTDLKWTAIVADGWRTCGLTTAGTLWCWGNASPGPVGEAGMPLDSLAWAEPLRVGTGTDWEQVAAGAYTCAVRTDRSLACWGRAVDSPDEENDEENTVTFPDGARWRSIAVDGTSACGVLTDASLWCTGYVGRMYHEPAQKVGADATWSGVSVAGERSCGLRTDATVWCWGLPPGETQATPRYSYRPEPAPLPAGRTWAGVTAGCARDTEGKVWCWGEGPATKPADLPATLTVDARRGAVCAVTTGHDLRCWGSIVPDLAGGSGGWADVSVGGGHACGIRTDRSLWCWGAGASGALGDYVLEDQHKPIRVRSTAAWIDVSAGAAHTCGIQSDHSLWCWGSDADGQLGATFPVRRLVPVPAI